MLLTIDNLDGLGAVDYSAAVMAGLSVVRTLNAPSTVEATLCLEGSGLTVPVRRGRVVVASEAGVVLFTGYLTTEPVPVYAGVASQGPVYRLALRGISDEWMLDKQPAAPFASVGLGVAPAGVLGGLMERLGVSGFSASSTSSELVGVYQAEPDAAFSANAGALAAATYGAYRVLNGAVSIGTAGTATHVLSDGDGSLDIAALRTAQVRELANDVTVSGAMEPAAYWQELFLGDGATAAFSLSGQPEAVNDGHAVLVEDGFNQSQIDTSIWSLTDPGAHLALGGGVLGGGGLVMNGGNGLDGQTTLTLLDPVEMGGTLVLELDQVALNPASAGVLGGFYQGTVAQANCLAGFNIRQAGGDTVLTPMVNGAEIGTTFTIVEGHLYTLRLRLNCPEMLRIRQAYYAMEELAAGGFPAAGFQVAQFGAGLVDAPMSLVFEVQDLGLSSNTPVTVLYDGALDSTPASCTLAAVDSVQLFGSVGAVRLTLTGSGWVRSSDPATGLVSTRLIGSANQGVDGRLTGSATAAAGPVGSGTLTFFAGRVPAAGSLITVSYRGRRRAVTRMADVASVAQEAAGGAAGTARWLGKVLKPAARSTEDCEAAAAAILSFAANRAAAVAGSYTCVAPAADVWPGDALAVSANGSGFSGIVRKVTVEATDAAPEALVYKVAFANDWAEGLGLTLSEALAADALLPAAAIDSTVAESARVLANLQQLTVPATAGTGGNLFLQVDAGQDAPAGGGFEVRRRDGGFGQGAAGFTGSDLVLRSPIRGFQIPIGAVGEQFFVRMYDGSNPPLYSRASSAIVTHLPLG